MKSWTKITVNCIRHLLTGVGTTAGTTVAAERIGMSTTTSLISGIGLGGVVTGLGVANEIDSKTIYDACQPAPVPVPATPPKTEEPKPEKK